MLRELGKFERALLISDRYSPFNIVVVLQLENAPTAAAIKQSLERLQRIHSFLRARIVERKPRPAFELMQDPELEFSTTRRTDSNQWKGVAEREMSTRVAVNTGPLWRANYLSSGRNADLILTFHHSTIDAASLINLLGDLLQNCSGKQSKSDEEQSNSTLIPPVEDVFPEKYRGLRSFLPTLSYGFSQFADEISYRWQSRGKRVPKVKPGGLGHILTMIVEEPVLNQIGKRARHEGVTLNSFLNSTMMLAVNRHLYGGESTPMRTFAFADLRPYTRPPMPPDKMANYISMMRFTQTVSGTEDIWQLTKALHPKIYHELKHGDKFIASTMSEPLMKMFTRVKTMRLGSTALNYSGAIPLQTEYSGIKVLGLHAFISGYDIGPEFASQARIFDDRLWWDFVYLDSDTDRAMAEKIVEEINTILVQAV